MVQTRRRRAAIAADKWGGAEKTLESVRPEVNFGIDRVDKNGQTGTFRPDATIVVASPPAAAREREPIGPAVGRAPHEKHQDFATIVARDPEQGRAKMMRRMILASLLCAFIATNSGCFVPIYSGDPTRRTRQLIFTSEDLRSLVDEWERFWFLDQPSHMKPYRTHGGII